MSDKVAKISKIILWIMLFTSAIFFITIISEQTEKQIENALIYAYILVGTASLTVIVFSVLNFVKNISKLKQKSVVNFIFLIFTILITTAAYFISATSKNTQTNNKFTEIPEKTQIWSETGIYVAYAFIAIAVAAVIFSEIKKFITK